MGRHASSRIADAEKGGNFGFPPGAVVTIIDVECTTWGEAGEKAITKGRRTNDPALKIVGELEGIEEPRTIFLGAGKAERLEPSPDGDYFDIAEGSSANALHSQCDTYIFVDSIFFDSSSEQKKKQSKAYKMHGKDALPDSMLDDGYKAALIGLKFKAGSEVVREKRAGDEQDPKPSLICDEIIEKPSGKGKAKKTNKKPKNDDDEEDEDEPEEKPRKKPAKEEPEDDDDEDEAPKKKPGKKAGSGGAEKAAEKAGIAALENPKYRKGCPVNRFYNAVHAIVRDEDNVDDIMKFIEDDDWAQDKERPWEYDSGEEVYKSLD